MLSILIFSTAEMVGQDTKERVAALFGGEDNVEWIRFFRGRMNDINDVMIALGSDGKSYKGVMKFLRSSAEFQVFGVVNDNKLRLTERDSLGMKTGFIEGTIDDFEGIKAEWRNFNNTLGGSMALIPYPTEPEYPTYCGDNKWIRIYNGSIGEEAVDFLVSRGTNFSVEGIAYFQKQNKSYRVSGKLTNYNRDITLELVANNFENIGSIKGNVDFKTDSIAGTFTDLNGRTFACVLKKAKTVSMGCIEYADFMTELEVTYPKTRNIKFNEWLNAYVQEWLNMSRAYTRQYRAQMKKPTPLMRASLRSYFWCDVEFYSSEIISGKATHTHTWEKDYQSWSFNFDFNKNEEITLASIFDENSDYKAFIQSYIQKEMGKRPFYSDSSFQNWLKKETFEHFTIRQDGINFVSEFNAIFGEQHCTIPYTALQPYLKPDNAIRFLYEEK